MGLRLGVSDRNQVGQFSKGKGKERKNERETEC